MVAIERYADRLIARVPGGRRIAPLKDRLASFADQGVVGVANLGIAAVLARGLGREQFGSIGVMLGIYYFVAGFHRANVVLPFIVSGPEDERAGRTLDDWWRINLAWVALIGLALALLAGLTPFLAPHSEWITKALAFSTMATPPLLLAEFGRRWLYQAHASVTVALSSTVYAIVGLGVAFLSFELKSVWIGAAAWSAAGLSAFLVTRFAHPPGPASWRGATVRWLENNRFGGWQSACHIPYAVYNPSVVVLIGFFGGPVIAAGYAATRTLVAPALSVITAVDSLDKPRAARALVKDGVAGLNNSIRRTRRLLMITTGSYLGLLALFPDVMLHLAFGHAYDGRGLEVRLLSGAFFLSCLNQPSETLLIVLREGALMFTTRLLTAVTAVIGIWWGCRLGGGTGCAAALLGIQSFNLCALRIAEYVAERRKRETAVRATLADETRNAPGFSGKIEKLDASRL